MSSRKLHQLTLALVTLICGLGLAVLLGEVLVRVVAPQNMSNTWREYTPRGYKINRPGTFQHQLGDHLVHYELNELRLRGEMPREGATRILALGDSITFGWLIGEGGTFLDRLQRMANEAFGDYRFQFLNGGGSGWGTARELAFLEDYGDEFQPDIVLVFISHDDLGRSFRSGMYTFDDNGELVAKPNAQAAPSLQVKITQGPVYQWMLTHCHVFQLLRTGYSNLHKGRDHAYHVDTDVHEIRRLGKAMFTRMKAWCDERDVQLLAVSTGWRSDYEPSIWDESIGMTKAFMSVATDTFTELDIPFNDPGVAIEAEVGTNYAAYIFAGDNHPNEKGAEVIARHAWPWLQQQLARYEER